MRDFRTIDAWHKAHALTLHVYRITESFPKTETFGLSTTLRRKTADLTMKIAEGCGKDSNPDFVNFLQQGRGIGMEVEYQLLLAHDLHLVESKDYEVLQAQVIEVRKMLSGLMKTLRAQSV